jgi:hypothetical protein
VTAQPAPQLGARVALDRPPHAGCLRLVDDDDVRAAQPGDSGQLVRRAAGRRDLAVGLDALLLVVSRCTPVGTSTSRASKSMLPTDFTFALQSVEWHNRNESGLMRVKFLIDTGFLPSFKTALGGSCHSHRVNHCFRR